MSFHFSIDFYSHPSSDNSTNLSDLRPQNLLALTPRANLHRKRLPPNQYKIPNLSSKPLKIRSVEPKENETPLWERPRVHPLGEKQSVDRKGDPSDKSQAQSALRKRASGYVLNPACSRIKMRVQVPALRSISSVIKTPNEANEALVHLPSPPRCQATNHQPCNRPQRHRNRLGCPSTLIALIFTFRACYFTHMAAGEKMLDIGQ